MTAGPVACKCYKTTNIQRRIRQMENYTLISIGMIITSILNIIVIALLAYLVVIAGKALNKYLKDDKKKQ
jgi:large-conductance mechanosensitive channel